ncbi:MAG: hypothetical protein ABSB33_14625 [Tepidisphaeraceae bacterium]
MNKCAPTARFARSHRVTDEQMMIAVGARLRSPQRPNRIIASKTGFSIRLSQQLVFGIGFVLMLGVIVVVTVMGD